jgi:transglutaminase/protease-like cytokinesis protein 3
MSKNIYIIIIFIGLYLIPIHILSQSLWKQDYKEADGIAAKTKNTTDVKKLSHNLTVALPDTINKYRAIFSWIAFNIAYDVKGLKNYSSVAVEPKKVLAAGKSVCEGYANLFKALCEASGLPCAAITGWTKNMPDKIGKPFTKYTTHAWNSIRIGQKWYLCDVTWGSGSLDDATHKFKREFNDFYFCMPENLFFLNHYPEDPKWMLGYKISKTDFIEAPHFFNPVLAANIRNLEPSGGTIKFKKKQIVKFSFTVNKTIQNILVKPNSTANPTQVTFKQKKNNVTFEYELNEYAQFLYIYLNNEGSLVYRLQK